MQQQEVRLEIAKRLLSSIIAQDRNRSLVDRSDEIDHSLDLADELIRRSGGYSTPLAEHTLRPRPSTRTRERVIDRDNPPLNEILAARRAASLTPAPPERKPKLH
jgi:hypothetical protein